jgi:hypothetical protein
MLELLKTKDGSEAWTRQIFIYLFIFNSTFICLYIFIIYSFIHLFQ